MPHSGGGGSSSGGDYYSSSSDSDRDYSSHSILARSTTDFDGARTYVYYLEGKPNIVYAIDKKYVPQSKLGYYKIAIPIIWLLVNCMMLFGAKISLGPLKMNYDTEIIIEDELGLIENRESLLAYLGEFQNKTGITPAIVTRPYVEESGDNKSYSAENLSYSYYIGSWEDESHWLIYYMGSTKSRDDYWEWNLMCGDDCLWVLDSGQEKRFVKNFNSALRRQDISFDDAIKNSLKTLQPDLRVKLINGPNIYYNDQNVSNLPFPVGELLIMIFMIGAGIVFLVKGIREAVPLEVYRAQKEAIDITGLDLQRDKRVCEFCNKEFYMLPDTMLCPHCGEMAKYSMPE